MHVLQEADDIGPTIYGLAFVAPERDGHSELNLESSLNALRLERIANYAFSYNNDGERNALFLDNCKLHFKTLLR